MNLGKLIMIIMTDKVIPEHQVVHFINWSAVILEKANNIMFSTYKYIIVTGLSVWGCVL
jgi:hypothetical protein